MQKAALAYGALVLSVSCADAARPPVAARPPSISQSAQPIVPMAAIRRSAATAAATPFAPEPPPAAPLSKLSVSPPPGATEAEAALVWLADGSSERGIKTFWISSATGRAGDPVWIAASREEPVVVGGSRLLAIRSKAQPLRTCDCAACEEGNCRTLPATSNSRRPTLVDLGSGASRGMLDRLASPDCRTEPVDGVGSSFQILSAVGTLVFFTEHLWTQYCGAAHGSYEDYVHAVDVASGKAQEVAASPEQIAALSATARDALVEEHGGCMFEPSGPPDFYSATVGWGPGGALRGAFTFTVFAPYACGTGPGHYSVATTLDRDDLPAIRPPLEMPPAWLVDALGSDVPVGITQLPSRGPREKLLATFRTASVPAESP